jgi:hypothetical protein
MKFLKLYIAVILIIITNTVCFSDSNDTNRWEDVLSLNNFVPGTAQLALGKYDEGTLYLSSLPLLVGGSILACYGLGIFNSSYYNIGYLSNHLYVKTNNLDYYWYDPSFYNNSNKWMVYVGFLATEIGGLFYAYSQYDAQREINNRYHLNLSGSKTNSYAPEGLLELAAAPWKPENVFSWDVIPVLPLLLVAEYSVSDFQNIGNYFHQNTVRFFNAPVSPLAGLGLVLASAMILNTAVAPFEEISFRGISLNNDGQLGSSLYFGGMHLANMIMPNVSVEETIQQAVFATLYGFYSSQKTLENNFDFQKMIAFHFWNNVISMALDYMINPDKQLYFCITVPIRF